jgi:hypothetical protein
MRFGFCVRAGAAALALAASNVMARTQDDPRFAREIETKYVFGFTEGSGIGLEGEKEVSIDTEMRLGKAHGAGGTSRYWGSETKLEFEFTPNQYVQFEFGPFLSAHGISNVPGLANLDQFTFGGVFGEIRYILLDRGPNSPLALTLSAEPEWRHIDETSGDKITNFELELKLNADLELIRNRLYLGANLLYEPETTHEPGTPGWEKESKGGISAALAYRVLPQILIGAEAWYLRHYDGAFFNSFTGDAIYLGPTLFVQLSPKVFLGAAWGTQVWGRDMDDPAARLNLGEFSRQRAKLKLAFEF